MKWTNKSGNEIETNDRPESIEAAEKAGWKKKRDRKPKKAE